MDKQIKVLEDRMQAQEKWNTDTSKKMDENFEELIKLLQAGKEDVESSASKDSSSSSKSSTPVEMVNPTRPLGMNPKIEFPKFDGSNANMWVKKCFKYFSLCKIPIEQWVDLASLNMINKAETWVMNYLDVRKNFVVDWNDFVTDLKARFKENTGSIVEQFNKLQQVGTLEDYIDNFENIRSVMMSTHALPEKYVLDSFISGLTPFVKPFVKALKPTTISEAIDIARLQEEALTHSSANHFSTHKSQKLPYKSLNSFSNHSSSN